MSNTLRYIFKDGKGFHAEPCACTAHISTKSKFDTNKAYYIGEGNADREVARVEYHTKDMSIPLIDRRRLNRWLKGSIFAKYLKWSGDDVWATWYYSYIPRCTIIFSIMRYAEESKYAFDKMVKLIGRKRKLNYTAVLISMPFLKGGTMISGHEVLRPFTPYRAGLEPSQGGYKLLMQILDTKSTLRPIGLAKKLGIATPGDPRGLEMERAGVDESLIKTKPWEYFSGEYA